MNNQKHNWILYLISATILATIAIQFYWNFKNYEQNKQRVLNEIQLSLDNAIEQYFADLSKRSHFSIIENDSITIAKDKKWKNIYSDLREARKKKEKKKFDVNTIAISIDDRDSKNQSQTDSILNSFSGKMLKNLGEPFSDIKSISNILYNDSLHRKNKKNVTVFRGKKALDSLKIMKGLKGIFISVVKDSIDFPVLDSILNFELSKRKIQIPHAFKLYKNDSLYSSFQQLESDKNIKVIQAKSTFFANEKKFKMSYVNPTSEALKRSSTGILLSLLLSLAVISSLFYLLKIINRQKELAEIKNDLISNITHEFKTPITTVSTALEAINNFNVINDKEKTQTYVDISKNQVEKLHLMVEKLLETATLDSEKLLLKKEEINLVSLVEKMTKKHQLITSEKSISFNSSMNEITTTIDVFHFENAISNLIDNAIKYGGDKIDIHLSSEENKIIINVSDNGKGIEKTQQNKIFDKFYRVPKGNTHDVKGFGIGLYYTKKIIEKHNGTIDLKSNTNQTTFTISLHNEY